MNTMKLTANYFVPKAPRLKGINKKQKMQAKLLNSNSSLLVNDRLDFYIKSKSINYTHKN